MKCSKCGVNNATTHIRSIVNGVLTEKYLCEHCAAEEDYKLSADNGIADMLASMFGGVLREPKRQAKRCPVCRATFGDIANSGKVGCATCYSTFKEELLPYLKRVHGSTKHIGAVPTEGPFENPQKTVTPQELRTQLNRLVAEEKYEQAAVIRDKIKELEAKGNE